MAADAWSPDQYQRFQRERSQPFHDLLALVQPRPAMRVVDLGCGTGELTAHMHRSLAARETLGIDSSAGMLAKSLAHAGDGLRFEQREIAEFVGERSAAGDRYDLVYSNAALHWLPDHERLFERITELVAAGGQLAVQMPANFDHVSHTVADEIARQSPFRAALGGHERGNPVAKPEEYAALLERLGYHDQSVRLQVYGHRLDAREDVIEWVKGTLLTDYQSRLPKDLAEQFVVRYRERLLPQLADSKPFFYPFKRILLWARR